MYINYPSRWTAESIIRSRKILDEKLRRYISQNEQHDNVYKCNRVTNEKYMLNGANVSVRNLFKYNTGNSNHISIKKRFWQLLIYVHDTCNLHFMSTVNFYNVVRPDLQ